MPDICFLRCKSPHLYIDGIVSLLIRQDQSYFMIVFLPLWFEPYNEAMGEDY
jgi:hypothetical protein